MSKPFFHGKDHHIWSYCLYLGPYTDEDGRNVDLGVYVERPGRVSLAAVYGPEDSQYQSGEFIWNGEPIPWISERPIYKEALRRYREHLAKETARIAGAVPATKGENDET